MLIPPKTGFSPKSDYEAGLSQAWKIVQKADADAKLKAVKTKSSVMPKVSEDSPRVRYRSLILTQLKAKQMTGAELRSINGAAERPLSNLHSWALVDLQKAKLIKKLDDGRYAVAA